MATWTCASCGNVATMDYEPIEVTCRCGFKDFTPKIEGRPKFVPGPGRQLHNMLASIGLPVTAECHCRSRIRQMNAWGVQGCIENRDTIKRWLIVEADKCSWWEKLMAAAKAVEKGIPIDPLDPIGSLLDEAIRRAS